MNDFNNLMDHLIDKDFPYRNFRVEFTTTMRTQINEIDSDQHMRMHFMEFLEAFCRIIDAYSPIPIDDNPVYNKL